MGASGVSKETLGLPQFLVTPEEFVTTGSLSLTGQEANHLAGSRRLKPGQMVRVADGTGRVVVARIVQVERTKVGLAVEEYLGQKDDLVPCTVLLSLFRIERFELALSKLFEMGIARVQPVIAKRSLSAGVRPEKFQRRLERWRRLALEALKQSRGFKASSIGPVLPLKDAASQIDAGLKLALFAQGRGRGFLQLLERETSSFPCCIVIGPEGGFAQEEKEFLKDRGFLEAGLGSRILRSETAAIYAASNICEVYLKRGVKHE